MLAADNIKVLSLSKIHCNCNNTTDAATQWTNRHPHNVFTRNLETKITSSVNWLPLYDHFPTVGLPLQNPG